jgi:hypothetical protein
MMGLARLREERIVGYGIVLRGVHAGDSSLRDVSAKHERTCPFRAGRNATTGGYGTE